MKLEHHNRWRANVQAYCVCCKSHRSVSGLISSTLGIGRCDVCGYAGVRRLCDLERVAKWKPSLVEEGRELPTLADLFPSPRGVSSEEHTHRVALLQTWLAGTTAEFLAHLTIFADYLNDIGSVQEAAARAKWMRRFKACKCHTTDRDDGDRISSAVTNWCVKIDESWAVVEINYPQLSCEQQTRQTGIVRPQHNAGWFLCFPPGWVRFTSPASYGWWNVTIAPDRGLRTSQPTEHVHGDGYATLFHPTKESVANAGIVDFLNSWDAIRPEYGEGEWFVSNGFASSLPSD